MFFFFFFFWGGGGARKEFCFFFFWVGVFGDGPGNFFFFFFCFSGVFPGNSRKKGEEREGKFFGKPKRGKILKEAQIKIFLFLTENPWRFFGGLKTWKILTFGEGQRGTCRVFWQEFFFFFWGDPYREEGKFFWVGLGGRFKLFFSRDHDFYRGKGTFRKVVDNLKLIVENGFRGELIARMTVMEETDIEKQVKCLLENQDFSFSSVHWQLNAGFWGSDFARRNFKIWSEANYVPGVRRLTRFWVDIMAEKGIVLKLYPFLGIANSLLRGESSLLRCGGGWINYAIQTDGFIVPCPTMWGMKDYYVGHISDADPLKLKKIFVDKEPCKKCDVLSLCGGRCLYANITQRWNKNAYALVCNTVKGLVKAVEAELPRIRRFIETGKVSLGDFNFMKYNGCEIIP